MRSAGRDDRRWLVPAALLVVAGSAVGTRDLFTWAFELVPGLLALGVLVAVYRRFPFSTVVCALALVHLVVLAVGAKYTYAEAPPGEWMRSAFGLDRNPFDRVGHFMQGFVPALVAREVFLRRTPLRPGGMVFFVTVCFALAFSAFYELLEWWVVLGFYPDAGPEWLGHQGDPWDAQADMLMALIGAVLSQLLFGRLQDRQVARLSATPSAPAP